MISNLVEYFYPEQEFYLQNVIYNKLDKTTEQNEYSLNCIDSIQVDANEKILKVTVTRSIEFNPKELFDLSVSFGAILKFLPEKYEEQDWKNINLAEEFKENGEFVTNNLMSRISLLISQITSSYGQQPIVLPPNIAKNNK